MVTPTPSPAASSAGHLVAGQGPDRGGHLRHGLTEARAQGAVVGLHLVADQLAARVDELQLLDVELLGDHVGQAGRRLPLGPGHGHHDAARGWRVLSLYACRAARPRLTTRRAAFMRKERSSSMRDYIHLGPVAEVHRLGGVRVALGHQVLVQLLGQERHVRGQQLGQA